MLLKGNYRGGKHNPKTHKSGAIQKHGSRPRPFNAAKVARNCKQVGAKGNTGWVNAEMLRCPGSVPEDSNTVDMDMDMEPKAVEEQTTDENLDEMDYGITAMERIASKTTNRHDHSMACSDETVTIGSYGLLPIEESYQNRMAAIFNKQPAGKPYETGTIEDHDMSPHQESHETYTTADHDMDLTEGPIRTFTSADHGNKFATNPDETSNTADDGKNLVGSPNDQNVETKHFNLLGCPDNVRQKILRYVLVSDKQIKPYWYLGSLEVPFWDSRKENFAPALAAFACNQQLVNEGTTILYGENVFHLQHARVSLWWLQRIGSNNIRKIKYLCMSVEEGPMDTFVDIRHEALWYSIVLTLEAAQPLTLSFLTLGFRRWTNVVSWGLNPRKDKEVWEPRKSAVRTLFGFRGLEAAFVRPGPMVNPYCANLLQRALVMGVGQTDPEIVRVVAGLQVPPRGVYLFR